MSLQALRSKLAGFGNDKNFFLMKFREKDFSFFEGIEFGEDIS